MNQREIRKAALRIAAMTLGAIEIGAVAEVQGKDYYGNDQDPDVMAVRGGIREIEALLWKWAGD